MKEIGRKMVRKGSKLLPFNGNNILSFKMNVKAVMSRKEERDKEIDCIFALLENMSHEVLAVVTIWAEEDEITFQDFVERVQDQYCPKVPRVEFRRRIARLKPNELERATMYLARIKALVRSCGLELKDEWSEINERLYSALVYTVASSLPAEYFDKEDAEKAEFLAKHLDARQKVTNSRIWYGGKDRALGQADSYMQSGKPEVRTTVKEEDHKFRRNLDYVTKRLSAVEQDEEIAAVEVLCNYCGKRGHSEGLCLKRMADQIQRVEETVEKLVSGSRVNAAVESSEEERERDF